MKKTLLFDFAGVVATESYFGWLKRNIPDFDKRKSEFQKVADKVDLGEISDDVFFHLVSSMTSIPTHRVWKEMYDPVQVDKEMISLIQQLKKTHRVVLFSNYPGSLLRKILTKHDIIHFFDELFISSEQKVKKPDEKAFLKIMDHLNVEKNELLFIDDRIENVESGRKIGIDSVLFTDIVKLKKELQERGITESASRH